MEEKRQELAKLLKEASSNFKKNSPIGIDLRTASLALENMCVKALQAHMSTEVLSAKDIDTKQTSAEDSERDTEDDGAKQATNGDSELMKKQANINWNKFASAVSDTLVRSVVGEVKNDASKERNEGIPSAALPKEQLPNGENNPGVQTDRGEPEAEAKLAPEQTPEISKSLDSGADKKQPEVKTQETAAPKKAAKEEDSCEETQEKEATIIGEGVELFAKMDELDGPSLTAADQSALNNLFN